MLNVTITNAKGFFFDKEKVLRAVDKGTAEALSKVGAYVRRTAKGSIREAKKLARAGSPPHSHTGLLREHIYFMFDEAHKSVVIGPALLNQQNPDVKPLGSTVPGLLEKGGQAQRVIRDKKKHKERRRKTITVQARPYMGPALEKELPNVPHAWKDSIRE